MEAGGLLPCQPQQGPPGSIAQATSQQLQPRNNLATLQQQQQSIVGQVQLHQDIGALQQQQLQLTHQQQQLQQMGQAPGMGEALPLRQAGRQAVVDRLRRRIESYRRRQTDLVPKFDQSFHGLCEQNNHDTLLLKQRFLDRDKNKRQPKKNEKKQNENLGASSNVHVQQKFLKRTAEELETTGSNNGDGGFGEPSVKLQCTQSSSTSISHHAHVQHQSSNACNNSTPNGTSSSTTGSQVPPTNSTHGNTSLGGAGNGGPQQGGGNGVGQTEALTKFSVEIVQQLEFTTSAANSQTQQISTNVTVKALTNASVKSDLLSATTSPKSEPQTGVSSTPASGPTASAAATNGSVHHHQQPQQQTTTPGPTSAADIINSLVECKQEPDNDFDLEQCAAALEKDPCFPGFDNFMGSEATDDDAFKDLISEISDFHPQMDFIKDLDFDEKTGIGLNGQNSTNNNNNNNGSTGAMGIKSNIPGNGQNVHVKLEEDKDQVPQVMHQHQHQQQGQLTQQYSSSSSSSTPSSSSSRLSYSAPGLDYKSEMSPAAQTLKQMAEQHQHKSQQLGMGGFNSPAAAAVAAAAAAAARGSNARSPYAEFGQFSGGSADYLGSSNGGPASATTQQGIPYHKNNSVNSSLLVGFQQTQQTEVFTQHQQPNNQFEINKRTAGQQKQQQQQQQQQSTKSSMGPNGPTTYKQQQQQQYSPYGSPSSMPNHGSPSYALPPRISQAQAPNQGPTPQGGYSSSTPPRPSSGSGTSAPNIQINQAQQLHINNPTHQIQVSAGQHMQLTGDLKPNIVSVATQQGMYFNQQHHHQHQQQQQPQQAQTEQQQQNAQGIPGNQNDTYCTVSQTQTINFTQQNLRQRATAASGSGNSATTPTAAQSQQSQQQAQQHRTHTNQQQQSMNQQQQQQTSLAGAQLSEQQIKMFQQQQQLLRTQSLQQQQQHMAAGIIRPPPPEYKAAQAQIMHANINSIGQSVKFGNSNPIRRINQQQPIPPSGPMMRPQQVVQQSAMHAGTNSLYMSNANAGVGIGIRSPVSINTTGNVNTIGGLHPMQQRIGYPRTNHQRPPNVNVGQVDALGNGVSSRGTSQRWHQVFMQHHSQQQQQQQQGNFGMSGTSGGIQMNASQMQHQQQVLRGNGTLTNAGINNCPMPQQITITQQQQHQQAGNQMTMQLEMSQTQSINAVIVSSTSGNGTAGSPVHSHQRYNAAVPNPSARSSLQLQQISPQQHQQSDVAANDLSFDIFDNLASTGDTPNFNPQELLNSLESGFNIDTMF
ncbi:neurogenic protein mastermind [Copidosoma floridanum]|uniref:neurogenic protein mastermind n=1 Tax=Copidosoma floridanum TaxID=29053 RepID=UPI0006C9CFCF|nr:neurogenic protein mastermind [Copidosoma floridanum]